MISIYDYIAINNPIEARHFLEAVGYCTDGSSEALIDALKAYAQDHRYNEEGIINLCAIHPEFEIFKEYDDSYSLIKKL